MFESVLQEILAYNKIIIHRHNNPDGDALGSQIGLKHILTANFPEKEIYVVGDDAKRYSFMADSVMDTIPDEAYDGALAVILDTSAKALISDDRYRLAAATARIDHHIFCEKFTDEEVINIKKQIHQLQEWAVRLYRHLVQCSTTCQWRACKKHFQNLKLLILKSVLWQLFQMLNMWLSIK